jgi:hypothetical protein
MDDDADDLSQTKPGWKSAQKTVRTYPSRPPLGLDLVGRLVLLMMALLHLISGFDEPNCDESTEQHEADH